MRSHPVPQRAITPCARPATSPRSRRSTASAPLPDITPGRREVKRLTGQSWVPLLVTDDGEVINDSANIIAWAKAHPKASADAAAPAAPAGRVR